MTKPVLVLQLSKTQFVMVVPVAPDTILIPAPPSVVLEPVVV